MIAKPSRNARMEAGTRVLTMARMPRVNAMSVAAGMGHPFAVAGELAFTHAYTATGANMPPTAATSGNRARLAPASSPCTSSRFISRPMSRKNTAIKPSLIQCSSVFSSTKGAQPMAISPSSSVR